MMKDKYSVFIKSEEIDQSDAIEHKFNENNFDLPNKINITVENSNQGKTLRTSKRLQKYFTREFSDETIALSQPHSFGQFQKRIYNTLLKEFKETNCFGDATIEGEFVNPLGHYEHESINLRLRIQEKPIFSQFLSLNIDKRQKSIGVQYQPLFTNMFGQCEFLSFSARKNFSIFDYNNTARQSASLLLPYASPELGSQEYKLTRTSQAILKGLNLNQYRVQANFVPASNHQQRWKYSLYSISHHYRHLVSSSNLLAVPGSVFDQTQNVYQNVILKARYMKDIHEDSNQTSNVIKLKGRIGYGSNGSVFTKLQLNSHFEKLAPFEFANRAFNGVIENRFTAKGLISAKDLLQKLKVVPPANNLTNPAAFSEQYCLTNEPSFRRIDLKDKSINSPTIGSQFYATNQTKLYISDFPFLQKLNMMPFLHFYSAFVPTNLQTTQQGTKKLKEILKQNVRASAGIGLTYRINEDSFKVDFIYSFGQFFAKPESDEFARFQCSFQS